MVIGRLAHRVPQLAAAQPGKELVSWVGGIGDIRQRFVAAG